MILYLDASALVKRYVAEPGMVEITERLYTAEAVGTSVISRVESIAAIAKAARIGILENDAASSAAQVFRREWQSYIRIQVTENLIARADSLAWDLGLRGYVAIHLASALIWNENMEQFLHLATFDRQLWMAANGRGLKTVPSDLPAFFEE